jgi:simple sugar transport system ATP-binding protein
MEVQRKISEFDIRPTDASTLLGRMSGGNQQKLVIARALDPAPEVLYVAHPTRGVDVGAIEKIHEALVTERNKGRAILLFSSELDELMDLSDRILVFYGGAIRADFARKEFDSWALGRVMGGGQK